MNVTNSAGRGESPSNPTRRSNQSRGQADSGASSTGPAIIMPPRPFNFDLSTDFPQPPHAPYLNSSATLPLRQPRATATPYNGLVHTDPRYTHLNGATVTENPPPYNEITYSPVGPRDSYRTFIHGPASPYDAGSAFGPRQTGPYFTNPPQYQVRQGTTADMQNPTQSTTYGPAGAFRSVDKRTTPFGAPRHPYVMAEEEDERRQMQHMRRNSEADKLKQLQATVESLQQRVEELETACARHLSCQSAAAQQADGSQKPDGTQDPDGATAQIERMEKKLAALTAGQATAAAAPQASDPTSITAAARAPAPTQITAADHRRYLDAIGRLSPDLPRHRAQRTGDGVVAFKRRAASTTPVPQPVQRVEMRNSSSPSVALDKLRQQSMGMTHRGGFAPHDDAMTGADEGPAEAEAGGSSKAAESESGLKDGAASAAARAGLRPKTRVSGGKTQYLKDKKEDNSSSSSFDNEEGRAFLAAKGKSMMQSRWADKELDG